MNRCLRAKVTAVLLVAISLGSLVSPAASYSLQSERFDYADYDSRAYNAKPNHVKKAHHEVYAKDPQPEPKNPVTSDSNDFSWTKIVSLGLQLVLSFFGNDNVAMDKMDPGSPVEAFLTAIIAYLTGSNNPNEVSVMAKQATELWQIVISLLDTLRTSFSKRSFEARAIGSNDLVADAAVATTSMTKSFLKAYNTKSGDCVQKYVCESNRDCANETSDTGYMFCQMATYALSYALDGQSYTPFETISDAGRLGRTGENCDLLFKGCQENFF